MSRLQFIPGIYQAIARAKGAAAWQREKAAQSQAKPTTAHEAELAATEQENLAKRLTSHAASNEAIINAGELLIHDLATSSHKSADRTLAQREFENAVMRLRRELGDKPQS